MYFLRIITGTAERAAEGLRVPFVILFSLFIVLFEQKYSLMLLLCAKYMRHPAETTVAWSGLFVSDFCLLLFWPLGLWALFNTIYHKYFSLDSFKHRFTKVLNEFCFDRKVYILCLQWNVHGSANGVYSHVSNQVKRVLDNSS